MNQIRTVNRRLILIVLLALALRLLFFFLSTPWDESTLENKIMPMGTDQRGYHQLANVLMEYGKLSYKPDLPPVVLRTPGYPLLISLVYSLFSVKPWVVILIQNFIDTATLIFIFMTFTLLFNQKAATITAILYSVEPHMILYANTFYSDTLFVFFLSLFFYFLIKYLIQDKKNAVNLIISSFFLGISALIKPAGAYLPYVIAIVLLLYYRKTFLSALKISIVFILFYLITISPWLIRNYIHYGDIFLSNSGEYNLLAINITPMEIPKRKKPQHIVERELRMEADSMMFADGVTPYWNKEPKDYWESSILRQDYNKTKYWKKVAINYIEREPLTFAKFYFLGIVHTIFNLGTMEFAENLNLVNKAANINLKADPNLLNQIKKFFNQKSPAEIIIGLIISIYLFIVYSSALAAIVKILKSDKKLLYLLPVLSAIYFIVIAGAGGFARFKMPAVPFYIGISGYGLTIIYSFLKNSMLTLFGNKSV